MKPSQMKPPLNKHIHILPLFILLILDILVILSLLIFSSGCSKIQNLFSSKDASNITTVKRQDLIQKVSMGGMIEPKRKTLITAPYNGYIKQMFVKIGDKLNKGDPIVSITQTADSNDTVYPIRAPYAGTVVQIKHYEGEFIKEADTTDYIVRIDDSSKLFVISSIGEIDRIKIKEGQDAIVKLTAVGDRTFKAVIRYLALSSLEKDRWEKATLADYTIRLEILDKDPVLLSGMSVIFDIITNKKTNVLTLAHEFIYKEENNYYVITAAGIRKDIKVGIQNEEFFEIIEGVSEGEKIKGVDFTKLIKN
ncbi:MAG: efflux RND transporter periplasmic adaptor subunit [Oligoflexia bacterium]|nr:efflux RND transporter periplasmic adaptor subunit [Oligoflexia bacterium]